jgi:hypothetical protein
MEIEVMGVWGDTGNGIQFIISLLNQFLKPAHKVLHINRQGHRLAV